MDQIKQQKTTTISTIGKEWPTAAHVCHTWHDPVADVGVEHFSTVKGCCVWEKNEESVRCEMDRNKNKKGPQLSTLGRKDLPKPNRVTLDTAHLLMSALNAVAPWKAVVFGGRKKKG